MGKVKQIAHNAKTFDEMTRQQKRHVYVKIKYKGRWVDVPVLKYLEIAAASLPPGVRESDGKPVDHLADLKTIYYAQDVEAVRDYIKQVHKIMGEVQKRERNKNKPLWRRILNV